MDHTHNLTWLKAYRISLNSFNSASHPLLSKINIFTDGSKTSNHTGAGFVIYREGTLIAEGARRLPTLSTVFKAEITAIQMAAHTFYCQPTDLQKSSQSL